MEIKYYTTYSSPFGTIVILSDGESVTNVSFLTQTDSNFSEKYIKNNTLSCFIETVKFLDNYFNKIPNITFPPLKLKGTKFQLMVWEELLKIKIGSSLSYGEIAAIICEKLHKMHMSAQAIGQAVSANPFAIIIPCHRVLARNRKIGGYNGGVHLKEKLLKFEGIEFNK